MASSSSIINILELICPPNIKIYHSKLKDKRSPFQATF
jgi:hypothetical protein